MQREKLITEISKAINYSFSRSSGPGGQKVNKSNTRVSARLPLSSLNMLSCEQLQRLRCFSRSYINENDELLVNVQEERSQLINRERAEQKLIEMVLRCLKKPKIRKKTRISKAKNEARLKAKKIRSEIKENRKKRNWI